MEEKNILEIDTNNCDNTDNSCLCQVIQCLTNNCKQGPTPSLTLSQKNIS